MQAVMGTTALLPPASDETQSLVLHYPTPTGVMQLTSRAEQGKRCIIVQGSKDVKTDILYIVEDEKHVTAASDRVRRTLGAKQQDMLLGTVERVFRIDGTGILSILVSITVEGKKHHAHYFSQDYYDETSHVTWKSTETVEPLIQPGGADNE